MWLISASQWTVHNVGSRYLAEQGRETQSHEAVSSAPTLRSITTKWMCLKKKSQQKHLILLIILIKFYLLALILGKGIESPWFQWHRAVVFSCTKQIQCAPILKFEELSQNFLKVL